MQNIIIVLNVWKNKRAPASNKRPGKKFKTLISTQGSYSHFTLWVVGQNKFEVNNYNQKNKQSL